MSNAQNQMTLQADNLKLRLTWQTMPFGSVWLGYLEVDGTTGEEDHMWQKKIILGSY